MKTVLMELHPFGKQTIEIRGAMIAGKGPDQYRIYAQVQNNPFVPLVSANTVDAREFANAILDACNALDRTAAGFSHE